ncbi:MAG TPA: histidine phosphatase family protein [Smithella sp.]|nr:histidine phosphatase family protein [Smithella sp.]MDM7988442.1 histidine phosphatase family protein [Smithella sp.]HNY50403.1 histidine phosphatase family protein [Smithella sp.]HOG89000.1 histidine phosphatase family protein [Smithella sp.]HOU50940.1 histidine phosphatase family protein [Smithella sp.]
MSDEKLYIVLMGLPARGKSTLAIRLRDYFRKDGIAIRIFNNGNLRRRYLPLLKTSISDFYSPQNTEAVELRKNIAHMNMDRAKKYLNNNGRIAILDATNASRERRVTIEKKLNDHDLLFIECLNDDEDIMKMTIQEKIRLPEFAHLKDRAAKEFLKRIDYYRMIYTPLKVERNYIRINSLQNMIMEEKRSDVIPFYDRLRDYLVTDEVRNLFLIRHTETEYNIENRIGGDPRLTKKGEKQALALGRFFKKKKISYIFTSTKQRTMHTAKAIASLQPDCRIIPLKEFDEINAGICEGMTYEDIEQKLPHVFKKRGADKYNYVYPEGESYALMKSRIMEGIKKAFFLNRHANNIMIVGHQAVNRMILSYFLYRREDDVPYIYIPQDRFYHIVSKQDKKIFELKRYDSD